MQLSLFDEKDMAEISSPDFPGERLVVCRNPHLAAERARKREDLLAASEKNLAKIQAATTRARNPLRGAAAIALKVGAVLGRRKVAKHFRLTITEETLGFVRDAAAIASEAALDGFYVLRTSVSPETLDAAATVLAYKSLAQVERAFRSLKSIDLDIRPVHHRLAGRVRAHVFLCMLAYYVAWHMRRKLTPLVFADHDREAPAAVRTSPVAAAEVSPAARAKAHRRQTEDGALLHSFRTLLVDLATLTRNAFRRRFADDRAVTTYVHPATRFRPVGRRPRIAGRTDPSTLPCSRQINRLRLNRRGSSVQNARLSPTSAVHTRSQDCTTRLNTLGLRAVRDRRDRTGS